MNAMKEELTEAGRSKPEEEKRLSSLYNQLEKMKKSNDKEGVEFTQRLIDQAKKNLANMKEGVSLAQQAAIAISKRAKQMKETHDCDKVHPNQSHTEYMKTSEEMEEKHVPGHDDDDTSEMMNAMKMNATKTGEADLTPDAVKLNAMIKDPHKSKEEDPKKDLNATYMKSDVRADVKNGGGTDMSKVKDAPKMMTAMKKISAMYKTEKYHDTKPGSLNDVLAQMHLNEHKTVSVKVQEFSALVETYLAKGGVVHSLSPAVQEVELNKVLKMNEVRDFVETYNKWFATNYRAEEFVNEGLTAGQKKLPAGLQKAILAKQGKKETKG